MKAQRSKVLRRPAKWGFYTDQDAARKIRAYLSAKGLKQGPFFVTAALEKITREQAA